MLERAGLTAALIGAQARNFWTEPRATRDFDFTVAAAARPFQSVIDALLAEGYLIVHSQAPDSPSGPDFVRLSNEATGDLVDLQGAKTPFQEGVLSRAKRLDPSQFLAVATPEDLIVLKLIANRRKDHVDLVDLGVIEGLDWDYVRQWSQFWEVGDRLDDLLTVLDNERQRIRDLYS